VLAIALSLSRRAGYEIEEMLLKVESGLSDAIARLEEAKDYTTNDIDHLLTFIARSMHFKQHDGEMTATTPSVNACSLSDFITGVPEKRHSCSSPIHSETISTIVASPEVSVQWPLLGHER
jgi:hypothetical protein